MRRHDHAGALRLQDFDEVKHVEAVGRAQIKIKQSQLHRLLAQDYVCRGHAVGGEAFIALGGQHGAEQAAGGIVVIHHQNSEVTIFFAAGHPKEPFYSLLRLWPQLASIEICVVNIYVFKTCVFEVVSLKLVTQRHAYGVRTERARGLYKVVIAIVRGKVPRSKQKVIFHHGHAGR